MASQSHKYSSIENHEEEADEDCEAEKTELADKDYIADIQTDIQIDYTQWMTQLPSKLHDVPLNCLAIPGSHDSGAYWLNIDLPIAPGGRLQRIYVDEPRLIKFIGSCAKRIVRNWSLTQRLNITEQLNHGIRYIDIRTVYKQDEDDFFFCHGLYGLKTSQLLEEIKTFLDAHPKEVVIVDFNHFYCFDTTIHERFTNLIISIFGKKLYAPQGGSKVCCTLNDIWKDDKQVLAFYYMNNITNQDNVPFWPRTLLNSPWYNTPCVNELITCLDEFINTNKKETFNVFQAILSPHLRTVLLHPTNSLEKYLADKCNPAIDKWLKRLFTSRKTGVNIVICDFVESDSCPSAVVKLNYLL